MATERLVIQVDETGARVVQGRIAAIGGTARTAAGGVNALKGALAFGAAAIGLRQVIGTLASFGQELSTIQAVSGATEAEFAQIRETAQELGATTRFSATQAAEGITFLSRAGFSAQESLAAIPETLALAQAGALDLGRAADIASNVLTGFNLEAEEAGRVADVLATAANSANTNVAQLGDALKFVAPLAASAGVSLEETNAAVGALSDAGLQATLAGTGLRRIIAELIDPSTKSRKALAELGIEASDLTETLKSEGLAAAVQEVADAGGDVTTAFQLFGQRGGPAFEVLLQNTNKVRELTAALKDAEGNAIEIARVMDDNLNGALLAVRSAVEAVIIEFGELGAEEGLKDFFFGLADAIRAVSRNVDILAATLVVALIPAIKATTVALVAFLATPIGAFLGLVGALGAAAIAFREMGGEARSAKREIEQHAESVETLTRIQEDLNTVTGFGADRLKEQRDEIIANKEETIRLAEANLLLLESQQSILAGRAQLPGPGPDDIEDQRERITRLRTELDELKRAAGELPPLPRRRPDNLRGPRPERRGGTDTDDEALEDLTADFNALTDSIFGVIAAERQLTDAETLLNQAVAAGLTTRQDANRTLEVLRQQLEDQLDPLGALNDELARERELTFQSAEQRQISNQLRQIEQQLLQQGVILTDDQTRALREQLEAQQELNAEAREYHRILEAIEGPAEDYETSLRALNRLLREGKISQEEFNDAVRSARIEFLESQRDMASGAERALLKLVEEYTDAASEIEGVITRTFSRAEDEIVNFLQTGQFSFKDFAREIVADLTRVAVRLFVLGPILQALTSQFDQLGSSGASAGNSISQALGSIGGFGDIFSGFLGLFSGGGGVSPGSGAIGGGAGGFKFSSLPGLQDGADFMVGARNSLATLQGTDNRLIAFRAQDGERVRVSPRGSGGDNQTIISPTIRIETPDVQSFARSEAQIAARISQMLARANRRNN